MPRVGENVIVKRGATVIVLFLSVLSLLAERINQEGRILGPLPVVTNAILFNTTNADAVVSAMQILPVTNPFNEDISRRPLLTNSDAMIAQISSDLLASRRTLRAFFEMNYVLAPTNQPLKSIEFVDYPDDSDLNGGTYPNGLYPIPTNMPVETWPHETGSMTVDQWQQTDDGSDRHSIIVQPGSGNLLETWRAVRYGTNWQAANGAKFNLNTNGLRPAGWTSGDAAGLPMFPALVRYDECERGMVEHACRIVVKRSRYPVYIYPATHYASWPSNALANIPAMGQRLRLKANFNIPANWTKQEKAVLLGLKKYGALVADNGNFFSISVTPDNRWPSGCFDHLSTIGITNFEVIQSTGTNEGPRSAGAPTANAGADRTIAPGQMLQLQGVVTFSNTPPAIVWKQYSGPGTTSFSNTNQTNTTVSFSAPGVYTLMLSADDGVHAVAYDAVVVNVTTAITVILSTAGTNVNLSWAGGSPPYIVQRRDFLPASVWYGALTTSVQNATFALTPGDALFRVIGN